VEELKIRKRSPVGCFLCLYGKKVEVILKACKYCGGIHSFDYECSSKPKSSYIRNKDIQTFRNSKEWRTKREEIKNRDRYICVACWFNAHGTIRRINSQKLSVHHIKPLSKAWQLRLNSDNLITLCEYHHEAAEKGAISERMLFEFLKKGIHLSPP